MRILGYLLDFYLLACSLRTVQYSVAKLHTNSTLTFYPKNYIKMMKIVALLMALLAVTSAFAPATQGRSSTAVNALFDDVRSFLSVLGFGLVRCG